MLLFPDAIRRDVCYCVLGNYQFCPFKLDKLVELETPWCPQDSLDCGNISLSCLCVSLLCLCIEFVPCSTRNWLW